LYDQENAIDSRNCQEQIHPPDSLQECQSVFPNEKDENQEGTIHNSKDEEEEFQHSNSLPSLASFDVSLWSGYLFWSGYLLLYLMSTATLKVVAE
jgi:hypothetical protein